MPNTAIKVSHLTKIYKLYDKPSDRLKESLHPLKKKYHKDFYALSDVSFEIKKGETVGIIGKNGAGKSTLLKIITGVLTPTSGHVHVNGRIASLLELGAGFNPEYTGVENIYFQGSLMGYKREEMEAKVADILAFADIGDFIYQPVKMYSSGMFARLAFAVAINVDPDILIVDEALSVGDAAFQAKCMNKFVQIRNRGITILLVSHDIGVMQEFASKILLVNQGTLEYQGSTKEGIDYYKKLLVNCKQEIQVNHHKQERVRKLSSQPWAKNHEISNLCEIYGNNKLTIVDFGIFDSSNIHINKIFSDDVYTYKMKIYFNEDVNNPIFTLTIRDLIGKEITGTNTSIEKIYTGNYTKGDEVIVSFVPNMKMASGNYLLTFACSGYENDNFIVYERLYHINIIEIVNFKNTPGYFDPDCKINIEKVSI